MATNQTSELFNFLPRMVENERSVIYHMTPAEKAALAAPLIWAVIWGSLMKFFLYFNLMQEKLSERPINVLILLDQVIDHLTSCATATYIVLKVSTIRNPSYDWPLSLVLLLSPLD